jgi:hypothetical protein
MKNFKNNKIRFISPIGPISPIRLIGLISLIGLIGLIGLISPIELIAHAQTESQFLASWQAKTYAPSWYQGKIFPLKDSAIEVSFELIENGKIADISKEKVRWYLNDKLYSNENKGLGRKSIIFLMPDYSGRSAEVRIEIFQYREGKTIGKIIDIPSVSPEVVIDSPYPNNRINIGASNFSAYPFFFSAKNLNDFGVEWSAMGQKSDAGGNPWQLNLNIDQRAPKNTEINLSVSVKNFLKELEFASRSLKLLVQ